VQEERKRSASEEEEENRHASACARLALGFGSSMEDGNTRCVSVGMSKEG
jgi:hypothetical protein